MGGGGGGGSGGSAMVWALEAIEGGGPSVEVVEELRENDLRNIPNNGPAAAVAALTTAELSVVDEQSAEANCCVQSKLRDLTLDWSLIDVKGANSYGN